MKKLFLFFATALFCLASCNNAEFDNNVADLGGSSYVSPSGDVYTIEIEGGDPLTKGSVASKSVKTANLDDGYSKSCNAQLKKNGINVSNATYSWSYINSGASYCALDNNSGQSVNLHGTAAKSQTKLIKVTGTDGVGSASAEIPVTVTDNINVDWVDKSMTLISGEKAQSNTIVTNSKDLSVKVTRPSNCKIGTSESSLGTSDITVKTGNDGKATVYVQYTGTSETTLSLKVASGSHSASATIAAKKEAAKIYPIVSKGTPSVSGPDNPSNPGYYADVKYDYLSNNEVDFYSISYEWDTQYETALCTEEYFYKLGYMKDDGTFVEFSNYKVYSNATCTSGVSVSESYLPWPSSWTGDSKRCYIYIKVSDAGYEGVYKGVCNLSDYAHHLH